MSFSFKNLGHYIAVAARDVVKFGTFMQKQEPLIEGVTALVYPPAVVLERAGSSALGYIVDAASKIGDVNSPASITISLTADEVADFKALAGFFKGHAVANGVVLPQ